MAFRCFLCGRRNQYGETGKHGRGIAGGRWKKRAPKTPKLFKPNLHAYRMMVEGVSKKVKLCTKCLRMVRPKYHPAAAGVKSPNAGPTGKSAGLGV